MKATHVDTEAFFQCLKHKQTTSGRRRKEDTELRIPLLPGQDPFAIDIGRILHSRSFRRLQDKSQVVTGPVSSHIRRRVSHTAEVVAASMKISGLTGLNMNLVQAIAWGHDLGHAPLGHFGEQFITHVSGKEFKHEVMSVVLMQHVEGCGEGTNLTHETLTGMRWHSPGKALFDAYRETLFIADPTACRTQEGRVVMYADKIAFLLSDYNDFLRMHFPIPDELKKLMHQLGETQSERIDTLVYNLCLESKEMGYVSFNYCEASQVFKQIREQMMVLYPRLNSIDLPKIIERVYNFLVNLKLPQPEVLLALMTDNDIFYLNEQSVLNFVHLQQTSVWEFIELLGEKEIIYWDDDLMW